MPQSWSRLECFLLITAVLSVLAIPANAADFTLGLKTWNVGFSSDTFDGSGDELFFPGFYFSWDINDRIWISAGYIEGDDVGFTLALGGTGTLEEVDSDFIVGWSFSKVDIGIGYRYSELTVILEGQAFPVESSGPMVYLGGGNLFGQSSYGYYWGVAYMFEDLEDDDQSQDHINAEAGVRWTSQSNLSFMLGYRYKEYSGDAAANATFDGPVMNIAFTWR